MDQTRPLITAAQLRAARALLRWDQTTVAGKAGISASTLKRLESGNELRTSLETITRLTEVYEEGGVVFLRGEDPAAGPGVCLPRADRDEPAREALTTIAAWDGGDVRSILQTVRIFLEYVYASDNSFEWIDLLQQAVDQSGASSSWPDDLSNAFTFVALDKEGRYIRYDPYDQNPPSTLRWGQFDLDEDHGE